MMSAISSGSRSPVQPAELENRRFTLVMLLAGAAAYLYLNLFILPGTPALLTGDQLFFWMNGQRMLHGELPYLDFFQFTPPGTDLVYFAVFKILGPRIWVVDAVVLLLGVALCWVCFEIAVQLMRSSFAVLATLLFLTLIYSRLLNATHHWFSVLAIMTAVAVLMQGTEAHRLGCAGALLGLASFFTQSHAVVALLAISFLLKKGSVPFRSRISFWRMEGALLAGFVIALLSLNAYFIARVGVGRLVYCQIYYVLRVMVHRPETALLGMPEPQTWRTVPGIALVYDYGQYAFVYAMLPVTYALAFARTWRRRDGATLEQWEVALLAITGSFLLFELIFSLNWLRLYAVSMPGVVLLVWLLERNFKLRRYVLAAAWIGVACLAVQRVWSTQQHDYVTAELPGGKCATSAAEYERLTWIMQRTHPGDFLFEAGGPGVYIPLDLRNPVFLDTAATMLNPEWAKRTVQQLDAKQVRYVLWTKRFNYPIDPRRPGTEHIAPLRSYLQANYQLVHAFPDGEEAWERR
jgi:hypothetical protein